MEQKKSNKSKPQKVQNKGGRKKTADPCNFRNVFYLTEEDNVKLDNLFLLSGMKQKSKFIATLIFSRPMKVVKIDKSTMDFYMRLTTFYVQFQRIGVNYNQITKAIKTNFSEKRAASLLFKLEKATVELVNIGNQVTELAKKFEQEWLQ